MSERDVKGCCCQCEVPAHKPSTHAERCHRCGKHRAPYGKINYVPEDWELQGAPSSSVERCEPEPDSAVGPIGSARPFSISAGGGDPLGSEEWWLSEKELDGFYQYAKANDTEPNGDQSQWADYTMRIIREVRALRARLQEREPCERCGYVPGNPFDPSEPLVKWGPLPTAPGRSPSGGSRL